MNKFVSPLYTPMLFLEMEKMKSTVKNNGEMPVYYKEEAATVQKQPVGFKVKENKVLHKDDEKIHEAVTYFLGSINNIQRMKLKKMIEQGVFDPENIANTYAVDKDAFLLVLKQEI